MKSTPYIKFAFRSLLFMFACLLPLIAVSADAGYPNHTDDYLNDFAKTITKADSKAIRTMFKDLEKQTGIEAVVVTINSIKDYKTKDPTIEKFATGLFNSWGVGHKKENNGVLILVAVKDRKCRIELGGGYGKRYDAVMKSVIDKKMIPYFKSDDYSRGIYEGSRGVIEGVTKKISWFDYHKWHILIGVLILICIFAGFSCIRSGKTGWGWAFFAAAAVLLFFLFRMLSSNNSSSGFGGGSSFGGGASGSW
jgi:uncharacterized protein